MTTAGHTLNYLTSYPMKKIDTFTYKVVQKSSFTKKDGTRALYLQIFINKERKQIPLKIYVTPKEFDKKKERVKNNNQYSRDYNLLIEQLIANVTEIKMHYRLSGKQLTMDNFIEDLNNPSAKTDFLVFYECELEKQKQKGILKHGTWRNQKATLQKLKAFKTNIYFYEIDKSFIEDFTLHLKKKLKNKDTTVQTALKNLKKYLHIANNQKIATPITYEDIKIGSFKGDREFLNTKELRNIFKYYNNEFILNSHKLVLKKFGLVLN